MVAPRPGDMGHLAFPRQRPELTGGQAGLGSNGDPPGNTSRCRPRENGVATDGALSALLVTVEEVDGKGLPLGQGSHEPGTQWVIGISDSRLPVAVSPRRGYRGRW